MQYQSLINSIKRGVLSPVYIIHGEEDYLQDLVVKTLKENILAEGTEAFNLDEAQGDKCSPAQVADWANALPVFAEKRLVIIKNAVFLQAKKKEGQDEEGGDHSEQNLLKYLADPLLSTCLVLLVKGSADRRKKLVKAVEKVGQVLEFNTPKGQELTEWIREELGELGKTIEPRALEYLLVNTGSGLRALKNELEKLALYSADKTITRQQTEKMLTRTAEASVFTLVDSLGLKKGEAAILEMRGLLESGEPPVRLLFMVARQFRLILQAKDMEQKGYTEKQVTSGLGIHPFVAGKVLRQGKNFTFRELEKALELILEADIALKTGGHHRVTLEGLILALAGSKLS